MAISQSCFVCSNTLDLLPINEELDLDESLCLQNNATALVKYCFNIKVENLDEPYLVCSTCLSVLIQAGSFKEKLLTNISSDDGYKDSTSTKHMYQYPDVHYSDGGTDDDSIVRDNGQSESKTSKAARKVKASIVKTKKKRGASLENKMTLKKIYIKEFESLQRNCKDFGLFQWNKSTFKCVVCDNTYADKKEFQIHALKHTTREIRKVYPKEKVYDRPKFKVDISYMKCRHCDEAVTDVASFRRHLSSAHKVKAGDLLSQILPFNLAEDEVRCGICNKGFQTIVCLNVHMNEHSTKYVCTHCGKSFITKNRLTIHMRNMHVIGTFKCSKCDKTFDTISKKRYHRAVVHNAKYYNLCPYCPETFKHMHQKIKHIARKHNGELKKYKCDSCPAKFVTSGELTLHNRRLHLMERDFKCTECNYTFFRSRELMLHMVTHTGERNFECNICHKTVARMKSLAEHMKIHNNDKRFVCQYCSRAFVQKCALNSHLKSCIFNLDPFILHVT